MYLPLKGITAWHWVPIWFEGVISMHWDHSFFWYMLTFRYASNYLGKTWEGVDAPQTLHDGSPKIGGFRQSWLMNLHFTPNKCKNYIIIYSHALTNPYLIKEESPFISSGSIINFYIKIINFFYYKYPK